MSWINGRGSAPSFGSMSRVAGGEGLDISRSHCQCSGNPFYTRAGFQVGSDLHTYIYLPPGSTHYADMRPEARDLDGEWPPSDSARYGGRNRSKRTRPPPPAPAAEPLRRQRDRGHQTARLPLARCPAGRVVRCAPKGWLGSKVIRLAHRLRVQWSGVAPWSHGSGLAWDGWPGLEISPARAPLTIGPATMGALCPLDSPHGGGYVRPRCHG